MLTVDRIDWNNPEEVEKLLASEWLWDLDNAEFSYSTHWTNANSIESYQKKFWVSIVINESEESVTFMKWKEVVGRVEITTFSRGTVNLDRHLYKSVSINERGKGIWTALISVFESAWFKLPNTEYSDTKSWVRFLIGIWKYELDWIIDERWENRPCTMDDYEIIFDDTKDGPDTLDFIVDLKLKK